MLTGKLRLKPIIKGLGPTVLFFAIFNALAVTLQILVHNPTYFGLPEHFAGVFEEHTGWLKSGVPFGAIGALGSALAIFLGFRNSSSYDRWWEARKIWGALVNDSRSFTRQCISWCDRDDGERLARELVHRHLAFVHGLTKHLRREEGLFELIAPFVPSDELEGYRKMPNVISAILMTQGKVVAKARKDRQIEHFRHLKLDDMLTSFSAIQGKCERIKNAPLPKQYDTLPRFFVYFYSVILPFGLAGSLGWATIPLAVSITVAFLLIESSGRVIEDPFEGTPSDTPMTALANTIERDLRAALGEAIPEKVVADPVSGALM